MSWTRSARWGAPGGSAGACLSEAFADPAVCLLASQGEACTRSTLLRALLHAPHVPSTTGQLACLPACSQTPPCHAPLTPPPALPQVMVVITAPAVRVAIGEELGLAPGTVSTGQMVAAQRALGFNYAFDVNFAGETHLTTAV